jgi:putative sigma-54 modulation protein
MQIEISGHQIDVTPALNDYVRTKLDRVDRHLEQPFTVRVILSVDKLIHKAEATLSPPGKTLFAEAVADDMYAAIDLLADKLDRIALKHKGKITDHHRGENLSRSGDLG